MTRKKFNKIVSKKKSIPYNAYSSKIFNWLDYLEKINGTKRFEILITTILGSLLMILYSAAKSNSLLQALLLIATLFISLILFKLLELYRAKIKYLTTYEIIALPLILFIAYSFLKFSGIFYFIIYIVSYISIFIIILNIHPKTKLKIHK